MLWRLPGNWPGILAPSVAPWGEKTAGPECLRKIGELANSQGEIRMSAKIRSHGRAVKEVATSTFEHAFQELENIVQQLETSQLSLDEALALFERGQALAAHCNALLEKAELKITQLTPPGANSDSALGDSGEER